MTKEEKIKQLETQMKQIEKDCSMWDNSSDRNMCLDYNGYFKAREELEKLRGAK